MAAEANSDRSSRAVFRAVVPAGPGILCLAAAVVVWAQTRPDPSDEARWGQMLLLTMGAALILHGVLIHRKAARDAEDRRRGYWRTVSLLLILTFLALVAAGAAVEGLCRLAEPPIVRYDYRMLDRTLGWVLIPDRTYQCTSVAKEFDVRVTVGPLGFREDGQNITAVEDADVVVIGDSNAFGFGLRPAGTLSHRIHRELADRSVRAKVLNAGVPGYGLGQFRLRLMSMGLTRPGPVVVLLIHPTNDLLNLSCDVDYGHGKPCTTLRGGRLVVLRSRMGPQGVPYHFGPMFDKLNAVFKLAPPKPKWPEPRSALAILDVMHGRTEFLPEPPGAGENILIADTTTAEQYKAAFAGLVEQNPSQWCSRQWPAIAQLGEQRSALRALARRVLATAEAYAEGLGGHLLVVVAEEPARKHAFTMQRTGRLAELFPQYTFEWDWSQTAITGVLEELDIPYVHVEYPPGDVERMFVPLDGHTSEAAFARIAAKVGEVIAGRRWLPRR